MRKGRCLKDHTLWLRLCKLNNPSTIWYVCVLSVLGRSATSGSLLSCGLQPARLLYPWDFPSVHPGMGGQNACIESYGLSRWLSGKESACQCRRCRFHPGSGRSPGEGNGNPPQCSCLGNPMDRGAWRATVQGLAEELDVI